MTTPGRDPRYVYQQGDHICTLYSSPEAQLNAAIEYIQEGECVEVTPADIRLRRAVLSASERNSPRSKSARGVPSV